jgi:hypothetical protein
MDEHVPRAVTEGLRRRGADVMTVREAGLLHADDKRHLEFALGERRVIFTQDADFLRLHAAGRRHRGIVYAPQGTDIGVIIRGLMLISDILDSDDMIGHVEFL